MHETNDERGEFEFESTGTIANTGGQHYDEMRLMQRSIQLYIHTFPVPGGPQSMRFGIFPSSAMARKRTRVSSFPTTSSRLRGRYFSTHGMSYPPVPFPFCFSPPPPVVVGGAVPEDAVGVALRLIPPVVAMVRLAFVVRLLTKHCTPSSSHRFQYMRIPFNESFIPPRQFFGTPSNAPTWGFAIRRSQRRWIER